MLLAACSTVGGSPIKTCGIRFMRATHYPCTVDGCVLTVRLCVGAVQ